MRATCSELKCPELRCQKVIQKEGECCKTCDTLSGNATIELYAHLGHHMKRVQFQIFIIPIVLRRYQCSNSEACICVMWSYMYVGMVNSVRGEYVNKCKRGGRTNSDLTVIPSLTNPCEVCYCWVRTAHICYHTLESQV